jgi:type I restriction enzyme S subunit
MSELPSSWARTTIREIAHTSSGGTPSRSRPDYFGGLIPWVKSGELNDGYVHSTEEAITEEGLRNSSAKIFPAGTVCIALYGATVGKTAILGIDASTNQAVCGIQPKDGIRRNYLFYFLQSQRANLVSLSQGGAQPNISQELVRATEIPIAPSNEQDRIVAEIEKQFTRLDAARAALKRVQANLKRYRASVLKAACEGRLVPTEAELARKEGRDYEPADQLLQRILRERRARWEADILAKMIASGKPPKDDRWKEKYREPSEPDTASLPDLPEGWCWAPVEQLGFVQLGRQRAPQHHQGKYMRPYLRVANVLEDRIDIADVKTMNFTPVEYMQYKLEPGDVLLNEGQSYELVGRPAMFRGEVEECCFQKTLLRFRPSTLLSGEFALVVFLAYLNNGRFQRAARRTTNMAHLVAERFAPLEFPLPPIQEQQRIVRSTQAVSSRIAHLHSEALHALAKAGSLRRSTLSSAFSGRLVSQDSNDEPASALLERIRAERVETLKPPVRRKHGEPVHA